MLGKLYKTLKNALSKKEIKAQKRAERLSNEATRILAEQEDQDWKYATSTNRNIGGSSSTTSTVSKSVNKRYEDGGPVMTQEFFVYGSLQPGRCNWDRLGEWVQNAERVQVPGHILILWSGFGGFVVDASVPLEKATSWKLPEERPKNYYPKSKNQVAHAKGWILTMRGTKSFFDMLDSFEGFRIGSETGSYVRRAIWVNGRWVWTYATPKDDPSLEKVDEWLDSHLDYNYGDWGRSTAYYSGYSRGGSRYTGSVANTSRYRASWEQDGRWDTCSDDDYSDEYMNRYGTLTKDQAEFAQAQDYLSGKTPIPLGPPKNDDLPDWCHEQRKLFDSGFDYTKAEEFQGLNAGFEDAELAMWSEDEDSLLKGDSWKEFVDKNSFQKV